MSSTSLAKLPNSMLFRLIFGLGLVIASLLYLLSSWICSKPMNWGWSLGLLFGGLFLVASSGISWLFYRSAIRARESQSAPASKSDER
jgi:hypothetical protein